MTFVWLFSQYRRKQNVQFSDDKLTVTYTQSQKYFFNAEASAPRTQHDEVVVLNMVMNVSTGRFFYFRKMNRVDTCLPIFCAIAEKFSYPTQSFKLLLSLQLLLHQLYASLHSLPPSIFFYWNLNWYFSVS